MKTKEESHKLLTYKCFDIVSPQFVISPAFVVETFVPWKNYKNFVFARILITIFRTVDQSEIVFSVSDKNELIGMEKWII